MAIDFAIIQEHGVVKGFKLTASGGRLEDEQLCFSFPFAEREGRASIKVKDKMIIFTHDGFLAKMIGSRNEILDSKKGVVVRDLTEREAAVLQALLRCEGEYKDFVLRVKTISGKKKGFKVIAEKRGFFSRWVPSEKVGTHLGCEGVLVKEKKGLRCIKCRQVFWQGQ